MAFLIFFQFVFNLKFTFSDMNIDAPGYFLFLCSYVSSQPFIFSLCIYVYLY